MRVVKVQNEIEQETNCTFAFVKILLAKKQSSFECYLESKFSLNSIKICKGLLVDQKLLALLQASSFIKASCKKIN